MVTERLSVSVSLKRSQFIRNNHRSLCPWRMKSVLGSSTHAEEASRPARAEQLPLQAPWAIEGYLA